MTFSELISLVGRYLHRTNDFEVSQMCGLAEGTAANTIKTTVPITYSIHNAQYTLPATDSIPMTACAAQAVGTYCYYLVSINAAGIVITTKGADDLFFLQPPPEGTAAIGAILVTTDASHTFTSGTTDLSATGITRAFYDIDTGSAAFFIQEAQTHFERGVTVTFNGMQRTIDNWPHMMRRGSAAVVQGATTVALPFERFKCFADNGVAIVDAGGFTTGLEKDDNIPLGTATQQRPTRIGHLPRVTTTFSPDSVPTMEFLLWPTCDQAYTINATAYQYSPSLDGVLYVANWISENAPDVLLFGALIESASYFRGADERLPEWKQRYQDAVWSFYQAEQQRRYNGSYIHTKFPDPMISGYDSNSIYSG